MPKIDDISDRGREKLQLTSVVIYGAGGHARELLFQMEREDDTCNIVGLVDDFCHDRHVRDKPVLSYRAALSVARSSTWILAVGDIEGRKMILTKLRADGIEPGNFVSRHAIVAPTARIGRGAQIFAGAILSDGVEIDENVIVNFSCVVSHDVHIGAHSTLSPRVVIAGHVKIGKCVFIGVGAAVCNGAPDKPIVVGDGAIIGAGACVIGSIEPGKTVVGVPARPI